MRCKHAATGIRKVEKAVAVRDSLLEGVSWLIFRRSWRLIPRFPATRNDIPAKVWALSDKVAAGKSAPPSGTLLDFLIQGRHNLLEFLLRRRKVP